MGVTRVRQRCGESAKFAIDNIIRSEKRIGSNGIICVIMRGGNLFGGVAAFPGSLELSGLSQL